MITSDVYDHSLTPQSSATIVMPSSLLNFLILTTLPQLCFLFFFFNDPATTEISPLSLHDALPISAIVHQLSVDVLRRAEHDEPWARGAPHHFLADPQAPPRAAVLPRPNLMDRSHGSFRGRLGRLARLAADLFARIADALPLVRLGWPHVADLGRHLAHQLLVHPFDLEKDVVVDRDLDALGRVIRHRVRKAHGELHAERLRLRLVTDPLDLEPLCEALRDPFHHVRDQGAREAVQRPVVSLLRRAADHDRAVLDRDRQVTVDRAADLALRSLDRDLPPLDLGGDTLGERDGAPADT